MKAPSKTSAGKNTGKATVKSENTTRISGKFSKGDTRSKTMTGNLKPSKGC